MRLYPVIILTNADPLDRHVKWIEVKGDGKILESAYEQVGEFIMRSLEFWHKEFRRTGREPQVRLSPRRMERRHIDRLEVETLINDPRTYAP